MNKPKAPRLVTVAIFTTITIIFWIFFSLYKILTSSPTVNIPEEILQPLTPTLDSQLLEGIPGRVFFEEGQVIVPVVTQPPIEIPQPEETTETSTEEAQITPET